MIKKNKDGKPYDNTVWENDLHGIKKPCGLTKKDTLDDAMERADKLASPTHHCGTMVSNKDLRRIVLLVYEYRKLLNKKSGVDHLEVLNAPLQEIQEQAKYKGDHEPEFKYDDEITSDDGGPIMGGLKFEKG